MPDGRILAEMKDQNELLVASAEQFKASTLTDYVVAGAPEGVNVTNADSEIIPPNGPRFVLIATSTPVTVFLSVGQAAVADKGIILTQENPRTILIPDGESLHAITGSGMATVAWQQFERVSV